MIIRKVLASSVAVLDSNVMTGGGTDDTQALQSVLDLARNGGGVHLVMDGAALVRGLKLYSNTTIECENADCGFYLMDQSNVAVVTNADWQRRERPTRNITLLGGTYNQNCLHQEHDIPETPEMNGANCFEGRHGVTGMEFCGIENLLVRDVKIVDFRTYAFMLTNFFRATLEDVWVDLPHHLQGQNQDGFHFWGPGQFLTVRNVGGKVGDDFMNLGPDEGDHVSSLTDVLVDGVFLDNADQGIRLLSRGSGRLDRVTIRNVQGTYRSYGFYINAWFEDVTAGNFGDLFFENISLRHTDPNYTYRPPFLFCIGGDMDCITLKNIRHEYPADSRPLIELGFPFHTTSPGTIGTYQYPNGIRPVIRNVIIDGVTVLENASSPDLHQIQVYGEVSRMMVKNVYSVKDPGTEVSGSVVNIHPTGHVGSLVMSSIYAAGEKAVLEGRERADELYESDVIEKRG